MSRLGSDIVVIQEGLSANVAEFIKGLVFVLASMIFLFILSWQLTLTTIISIMPVLVFSIFYGTFMTKKAKISTMAEETFSNVRTVKAFANEEEEIHKFSEENDGVYKVGVKKVLWASIFNMFANFFFYGSIASILLVGGLLCE